MPFTANDLDWFAARLSIAVYDTNREFRGKQMTPKLQGVLQSFNLLKHNLEADADEMAKRIQSADQRRQALKQNGHAALGRVDADMKDIEDFLGAMEGGNGAPLDVSPDSSVMSTDSSGEQAAPERLTVNGVSQS